MSVWMMAIGVVVVLLLVALLQLTSTTNRLLEMVLNRIHSEFERRKDLERQAEEDRIIQLRFEAERRAEEDAED